MERGGGGGDGVAHVFGLSYPFPVCASRVGYSRDVRYND